MDTLSQRWARLEPHTTITGPDDDRPRPAVLLFHGCGGLRGHLPKYAEVETWIADGTHSFDEPMTAPPMRYDSVLSDEALRRFGALLADVAVAPAA